MIDSKIEIDAALAGIENEDRLIEINDENIENLTDDQVRQRLRTIKYPQSLQLLVANLATYNHYKKQRKFIHNRLSSVQKLPKDQYHRYSSSNRTKLQESNSQSKKRQQYQLRRNPNTGYGFSVSSKSTGVFKFKHKITQIGSNSPAEQQGLRVGDYILSVNNVDVDQMSGDQFKQFLATAGKSSYLEGGPLALDVINEDSVPFSRSSNEYSSQKLAYNSISDLSDNNNTSSDNTQDESHLSIVNTHIQHQYPQTCNTIQSSSSFLIVCQGDLITQNTDVIVVCSSSQYLFQSICQAGGQSLLNSYQIELNNQSENSLIAINASGELVSKRIYFLPWKTQSNQSIQRFVSDAIERAVEENYHSIAFPAIGCGQFGCSISLVAQMMIEEAHRKSLIHNIRVSFVIQPERTDLYNEFREQINLIDTQLSLEKLTMQSTIVANGMIQVAKGDLTMQQVDVIIGSSSSAMLRQAIIKAAGNEVERAYNAELRTHPNSILIVTPSGSLPCKQIFFIKWEPDVDENILRQSLIDLISTVVQNVKSHQFTSIAFPAIGCGQHGCSINIVVETMVREMKKHLINRKVPWIIRFIVQPDQQNVYDEFWTQISKTHDGLHELQNYQEPSTWQKCRDGQIRYELSTTSNEYQSIQNNFHQSIQGGCKQIIRIERIQNKRWYMQYLAHCEDFKRRLNMDTEQRLYHGCPEQAVNSILEDCFNRSFAGVNGTLYGFGVYFSSNAAYSHRYALANENGERCMFLACVLVGKTIKGDSSMKTRPLGYDSTTDGNHIFVTYHDAQAFAQYLITYK